MAKNASFDILIDEIRPSVFAVGDDKKKGKGREGTQSHNYRATCDIAQINEFSS